MATGLSEGCSWVLCVGEEEYLNRCSAVLSSQSLKEHEAYRKIKFESFHRDQPVSENQEEWRCWR